MAKDKLGARMKSQYEHRTRYLLPRRTYTLIRLDGKAFHTFTKGFKRPFDTDLVNLMNRAAQYLCENIQGVKAAYVQSDEISLLLTDFEKPHTDAYFDGNIQKIASISASIATLGFNAAMTNLITSASLFEGFKECKDKLTNKDGTVKSALFDSRVFTIPDKQEVFNYFVWRQQDSTKNSIQMVAQSLYSHKELHGKNGSEQQEMIFQKGQNWNDLDAGLKRGRMIVKKDFLIENPYDKADIVTRTRWVVENPPVFTQKKDYLINLIPEMKGIEND